LHLVDAYCAKREYKRAILLLKHAQEADPDNAEIAEKLKKLKAETGER
jgi:hypothetical protein